MWQLLGVLLSIYRILRSLLMWQPLLLRNIVVLQLHSYEWGFAQFYLFRAWIMLLNSLLLLRNLKLFKNED